MLFVSEHLLNLIELACIYYKFHVSLHCPEGILLSVGTQYSQGPEYEENHTVLIM